jgi:heptosyltransferase I
VNILIVRLGALGDIVHTIPAAAALRHAHPDARIDWLVDRKHRDIVDLVQGIDRVVAVPAGTPAGWVETVKELRRVRYDIALDFQGLMKSAVFARASGAKRVIGFSIWHLREKTARPFYSETDGGVDREPHVIYKNLQLLRTIGIASDRLVFPLASVESTAAREVREALGERACALINPAAAWPNKRWPPERFGEVAHFLREVRGLTSVVVWGPSEEALAQLVVDRSAGAARLAPPTRIPDLLELSRAASLMLSGDTGPLHIAVAAGTPVVALFGPTDPARNGPWSDQDVALSRYPACGCHYDRRCHQRTWCLADITVAEVTAAIQQRLAHAG